MSTCSNCYNGCTEPISDKCVKYTGIDVPELGISNGDTLLHVENVLITFLKPMLVGNGITPNIDNSIICEVVSKYLPSCSTCNGFSLNEILTALVKASCDLQDQINNITNSLEVIESPYETNCLSGVNSSSNTHDVLQSVINKLCELNVNLAALALDVSVNYVKFSELDAIIQSYLNTNNQFTLIKNRMVPYAVQPYYGPLSYFDGTGAGTGDWINVYLCNGNNGTPDLRGRTLVGTTSGMFGGVLSPDIDPTIPGNPSYTLSGAIPPFAGSTAGNNQVTLTPSQIPSHSHSTTVSTVNNHSHYTVVSGSVTSNNNNSLFDGTASNRNEWPLTSRAFNQASDAFDYELTSTNNTANAGKTGEAGSHTHDVSVGNTGGGLSHNNVQPSRACYFIIYIP
jgi:microcystin-dependent protein